MHQYSAYGRRRAVKWQRNGLGHPFSVTVMTSGKTLALPRAIPTLLSMSRVTTSSSHFESGLSHLNGQTKIASSDNLAQTAFKIQTIRFYEANHER